MAQKAVRGGTRQKKENLALAYDLGGTKVAVGVVSDQGKILEETREAVRYEEGKAGVLRQLSDIGKIFLKKYPRIKRVGLASAGPLDPYTGVLLDPTNMFTSGESWGKVAIMRLLSHKLDRPVLLENDAAAAVLAEHWVGAAKKYTNSMMLTLGTGLGTGIISNGDLVRAGRLLHPEAGHVIIHYGDQTAPCGCGNFGCAEAYLSGRNFEGRTRVRLKNPGLTAPEIADLARKGDAAALAAFEEYSSYMATAIQNYVVLYAPQIVVFAGSFAKAADLFMAPTLKKLENLLVRRRIGVDMMPKLAISKLGNSSGIVGAAHVAFFRKELVR